MLFAPSEMLFAYATDSQPRSQGLSCNRPGNEAVRALVNLVERDIGGC